MPATPPAAYPPARRRDRRRVRQRDRRHRALGAAVAIACLLVAGCRNPAPTGGAAVDGLLVLAAGPDGTTLTGWDASGDEGVGIDLPKGDTTWIAAGRGNVLLATLAGGRLATSDPVHLGEPVSWRTVRAVDATGARPAGPAYFGTWDLGGGRIADLAGDIASGDGVSLVVTDPTRGTASEVPLDRSVLAAPPAWIAAERLVIVTGDTSAPTAVIVDTATGELGDGPAGARLVATSADGARVATMAGQGAPVIVREMATWLAGDGATLASIAPPDGAGTASAFALDTSGQRLAIAWVTPDGTIEIEVHDGRSAWRRTARPAIGPARGAAVAWRR